MLTCVTKAMAAQRLGTAKRWKQHHTDKTSRWHTSLMNRIVSIINEDNELQTICVSGAIITEDGTAEKQAQALVGQFQESVQYDARSVEGYNL